MKYKNKQKHNIILYIWETSIFHIMFAVVVLPLIHFPLYCRLPGNDRGEHKDPNILFTIVNNLGETIPAGVALRVNDKIRFQIELTADGKLVYKYTSVTKL